MGIYYEHGRYRSRIIEQGMSASKNGKPQFWVKHVPIGAYEPSSDVCHTIEGKYDRTIFWTFTDKTINFIIRDLERLGFQGSSFSRLDPESPQFVDFRGQEVDTYCSHETYEGKEREKWGLAKPENGGGAKPKPLDSKATKSLDALYGKKLKEKFGNGSIKPPANDPVPQQPAMASAADSDDIPF